MFIARFKQAIRATTVTVNNFQHSTLNITVYMIEVGCITVLKGIHVRFNDSQIIVVMM